VRDVVGPILEAFAGTPARAGRTRVLAIDGPSGAGKSRLAAHLAPAPDGWPVVHLDDLYPGWDGLDDGVRRLVDGVLRPLAEGAPVGHPRYDWAQGRDTGLVRPFTDTPSVLVVEGVGAGARSCAPYLSLLVWLDAPAAIRYERALARDGEGYRPHWQQWADQEEKYFAADDPRSRADLRLDTQVPGVI
jgi:uridine kinase